MRASPIRWLAAAVVLVACQPKLPAAGGPEIVPKTRPSYQGVITEIIGPRLKVEADQPGYGGSREAVVMLAPNARLMTRSGEPVTVRELDLDMRVSLWFTSPGDLRSGRLHATATTLVVEPR